MQKVLQGKIQTNKSKGEESAVSGLFFFLIEQENVILKQDSLRFSAIQEILFRKKRSVLQDQ